MEIQGNTFLQAIQIAINTVTGLKYDMSRLYELRKKDKHKDMAGTGRMALSIPNPLIPLLKAYHPELYQDDAELAGKAWLKFIKHPDSEPFRVARKL